MRLCYIIMTASCLLFSWVVYEGAQFTENMYVLERGEYPNREAMGLASSDTTIRSIQHIGHVSSTDVPQVANLEDPNDNSVPLWFRSSLCPPSCSSVRWTSEVAEWSSQMEPSTCNNWAWTHGFVPWWWRVECMYVPCRGYHCSSFFFFFGGGLT